MCIRLYRGEEEELEWVFFRDPLKHKGEPPALYGIWCGGAWGKEWGKDASQRVVFSTDADILKRNKGDWGAGAEVREIPPAMRWWLARGVNVVG